MQDDGRFFLVFIGCGLVGISFGFLVRFLGLRGFYSFQLRCFRGVLISEGMDLVSALYVKSDHFFLLFRLAIFPIF